jgi:hypothetical protein
MTSVALAPVPSPRKARSLGRELVELLAVGGVVVLLFPLSWVVRALFGLDESEYWTGFTFHYAAHLINDPHFAVTYLLFYRDARHRAFGEAFAPAQRARYLVAGVLVPLALGAWALTALLAGSAPLLGLMIQLMFLLVGWHYAKQGFGVMTVLSARRGVRYSDLERRVILAHGYAGWAYAWASPYDPGRELVEKGVVYTSLAHPPGLELVSLVVFVATAVALSVVLIAKWRRERRLPIATPLAGLLFGVWSLAFLTSIDPLVRYAIPALHSVQYLYFVALLRGNEAREREQEPYFEAPAGQRLATLAFAAIALGFVLFDLAPLALDGAAASLRPRSATDPLGATPWFAALYCFVNLHHYAMDAVIWRRDNPETRYLLD